MRQHRPILAACALLALAACERHPPQGAQAAAEVSPAPPAGPIIVPSQPPPPATAEFVNKAAAANSAEIAAARVAQARAASDEVRAFAAMIVKDHDYAAGQLAKAVSESGESLPAPAPSPSSEPHAASTPTDPTGFDKAYMTSQVKAHQDALALLQSYAEGGRNPALKAWAGQSAAVVQRHLDMASQLAARLT